MYCTAKRLTNGSLSICGTLKEASWAFDMVDEICKVPHDSLRADLRTPTLTFGNGIASPEDLNGILEVEISVTEQHDLELLQTRTTSPT